LDRYSLLGYVAPGLTSQLENLATEALLYLLRRYGAAKDAFADFVSETGHAAAGDLAFTSQVRMSHGSIPDLVGRTAEGIGILLVEAKFWAPLTQSQPTGYLQRLPKDVVGTVLFVAPERRLEELWRELTSRCRAAGLELVEETTDPPRWRAAHVPGAGRLAVASWSSVLDCMEGRLEEAGEVRGAHEVWQLEGLVRRLEEPLPIYETPPGSEERKALLRSIVEKTAAHLSEAGVFETKGYRATPGPNYYRRFGTLAGRINWSIGYDEVFSARFEESLLWLRGPRGDAWGRDPSSVPEGCAFRFYVSDTRPLFPLDIPEHAAEEATILSLADQVASIAEHLRERWT
jgi:hypothetical protein